MTKSYFDHVQTGELDAGTALTMKLTRDAGRKAVAEVLGLAAGRRDSAAFGMLDALAVEMVRVYGPAQADEVFRHYASVCARQHANDVDELQTSGDKG
ncbi:hypothetical protein [Aureimonas sp. AU40]|uniref:hypothetical protein n=1 Tax=Aureimonas sp. AU40 TaxID=1637747 RepID=UPI000784FD1E|nr:hypothetical protein [Aureimonas sp. AU40]